MSGHLRAVIAVESPGMCPVAQASNCVDQPIRDVSRATVASTAGTVAEEFEVPIDTDVDAEIAEQIFSTNASRVYRFERESPADCVCECIERHGGPVRALTARDGALVVTIHLRSIDELKTIVTDLQDRFEDVAVQQLTQSHETGRDELVLVDRAMLTERQREVLETSFELGYFEHPRTANAGEVADALGINRSTFREHLSAVERKLVEAVLQG